jgi:hypothetical protein
MTHVLAFLAGVVAGTAVAAWCQRRALADLRARVASQQARIEGFQRRPFAGSPHPLRDGAQVYEFDRGGRDGAA